MPSAVDDSVDVTGKSGQGTKRKCLSVSNVIDFGPPAKPPPTPTTTEDNDGILGSESKKRMKLEVVVEGKMEQNDVPECNTERVEDNSNIKDSDQIKESKDSSAQNNDDEPSKTESTIEIVEDQNSNKNPDEAREKLEVEGEIEQDDGNKDPSKMSSNIDKSKGSKDSPKLKDGNPSMPESNIESVEDNKSNKNSDGAKGNENVSDQQKEKDPSKLESDIENVENITDKKHSDETKGNKHLSDDKGSIRRVISFMMPPSNQKLGLLLADDIICKMPVLKKLSEDSPLRDKIPAEYHQDCCIAELKSGVIGRVCPKTAGECIKMIAKLRAATTGPVEIEMVLLRRASVASAPIPPTSLINGALLANPMQPYFSPAAYFHNFIQASNLQNQMWNPMQAHLHAAATNFQMFAQPTPNWPYSQFVQNKPIPPKPSSEPRRRPGRPKKKIVNMEPLKEWLQQYEMLVEYKIKHGNLDVSPSQNPHLVAWIQAQRELKKQRKLDFDRVVRLADLGLCWTKNGRAKKGEPPNEVRTVSWEERYEAVVRFKMRCGFFPASGELHDWLERQKNSALAPQYADRLRGLGLVFHNDPSNPDGLLDTSKGEVAASQFWQSRDAENIFGFSDGHDILKGLQERIDLLRKANESVNGWKSLVPNDGKEELYSNKDIMSLRQKAQLLIKAYKVAMKNMNKMSWHQCCEEAAKEMVDLGLTENNGKTITRWNVIFRKENVFPHPKRHVVEMDYESRHSVQIFKHFPKAKELFLEIAHENIDGLTAAMMREQVITKILPELERESREKECFDDGSPGQKLLKRLLANPPSVDMTRRWLNDSNIEWDKFCTRRGRNGTSYLSQRMKEAWAAGKYTKRRPKGQGLKKGKLDNEDGTVVES